MLTTKKPRLSRIDPSLKSKPIIKLAKVVKKKHLLKMGIVFKARRRKMGLKQYQLGQRLWPDEELSQSAAQTRVYRLESGQHELTYQETHLLFDILQITDFDARTLKRTVGPDQHGFLLDIRALELYPDLRDYLELINKNLKRGDLDHLKEVFQTMCRYLANTSPDIDALEKVRHLEQATGEHPFIKGAMEK